MPSLLAARNIGVTLVVIALGVPRAARADCAFTPPPPAASNDRVYSDFLIGGSTVFAAIPTLIDESRDTVAMSVTRVWKGVVHRDALVYLVDGRDSLWDVSSLKIGTEYLLSLHTSPQVIDGEFALLGDAPVGTLVYMLNCGETPRPISEVTNTLKRLGPGHAPLP